MTAEQARATFRRADRGAYPELEGCSDQDIYRDCMGPGGLYLATHMWRAMDLRPGDLVLDLGCGRGETSVWMATHFGVQVIAVDLWTSASTLHDKFAAHGFRQQIVPLHLDVTQTLPFADGYFDAIFSMNSLSFYGGSTAFLEHLLRHLRPGGWFCVGSECFDREFTPRQAASPPAVFSWQHPGGGNVWDDDFGKQHSPAWWADLFRSSGLLEVHTCYELPDGVTLIEDKVLHDLAYGDDPDDVAHTIAQLEYGRTHRPHQTLFVISAVKARDKA